MKRHVRIRSRSVAALAIWCSSGVISFCFAGEATAENEKLTVTVGQSVTHAARGPIQSVSIADTKVADVIAVNPHEFLLNGKAAGFTSVVVWDETRSTTYDVVVRGAFSDEQIELAVQVAEVNRSKAAEYGFDFLFKNENTDAGVYGGSVATPQIPFQIFPIDRDDAARTGQILREGNPIPGVSLAMRYVRGGDDLSSMIHLLQERGALKLLASPKLVASSGQQASFLSGGEIPVPVASSAGGGVSTVSIYWKEFGVGIDFLPTIVDSGVIALKVTPKVSSLDYANGIVLSGFNIPALRTRRAETAVELKNGETLVIGGLIIEEESHSVRRVPILGHIPLLGFFFRNSVRSVTESELLFVVTARIVHALPAGSTVPLPDIGAEVD